MSTVIDCPSCQRKLRVPGEFLGKSVRCPTCGETFDAAETAPSAPPAAPAPASAAAAEPSPLITVPLKLELDEPPPARPAAEEPPKEAAPPRRREPEPEEDDDRDERRRRRRFRRDFEPCPRCGDDIRRGAVVCPYCGLDLEEQGDGYSQRPRVRRDAEPHRGGTIQALGIASLILGVFYFFPLGLPLGIAAWVMGRRDLRKMDEGVMDPSGRKRTRDGRLCGLVGTILSSIFALVCLFAFFLIMLVESRPPANPPPVWQNNPRPPPNPPPVWQNNPPARPRPLRPQGNNFTLRGPQVVSLKRGETKVVTITIDRLAGWRGNVTVVPVDTDELDDLDVDPDEVKAAGPAATFRVTAEQGAPFKEQVVHFSATTDAGEEVSLDVRVNVVRGR